MVAGRRPASFGSVISDVVTDCELGFRLGGELLAVEQFRLEAALKRFGAGVVVAVAASAHALQRAVVGNPFFAARGRVLASSVGVHDEPDHGRRTTRTRRKASLTTSVWRERTSQPTILREQRSSHTAR